MSRGLWSETTFGAARLMLTGHDSCYSFLCPYMHVHERECEETKSEEQQRCEMWRGVRGNRQSENPAAV